MMMHFPTLNHLVMRMTKNVQPTTSVGRTHDSDGDTIPELESCTDADDDTHQPPAPSSPPMATSLKLSRDYQRLTLSMAHMAQFNTPEIAFPPFSDDDAYPASAQILMPAP